MLRSARSPDDFRPLIGNNRFPRPATPRAVSRCSKTDRSKLTIPPRYSKFSPLFFSRKPANGSTIPFPAHPSENAEKKQKKAYCMTIPANKKGRKRAIHVKYMNNQRAFKVEMGECTNGGRPEMSKIVEEWRKAHPDGRKADCIRETGLSKPTVYKWWK